MGIGRVHYVQDLRAAIMIDDDTFHCLGPPRLHPCGRITRRRLGREERGCSTEARWGRSEFGPGSSAEEVTAPGSVVSRGPTAARHRSQSASFRTVRPAPPQPQLKSSEARYIFVSIWEHTSPASAAYDVSNGENRPMTACPLTVTLSGTADNLMNSDW